MQIKTTSYHFIPIKMAIAERTKLKMRENNRWLEKLEPFFFFLPVGMNNGKTAVENDTVIPQKAKSSFPIWASISA